MRKILLSLLLLASTAYAQQYDSTGSLLTTQPALTISGVFDAPDETLILKTGSTAGSPLISYDGNIEGAISTDCGYPDGAGGYIWIDSGIIDPNGGISTSINLSGTFEAAYAIFCRVPGSVAIRAYASTVISGSATVTLTLNSTASQLVIASIMDTSGNKLSLGNTGFVRAQITDGGYEASLNDFSGTYAGLATFNIDTTGAAVNIATKAQLPTSLVGGRLDVNIGAGSVTANAGTDLNTSSLLTTSAHDAAFGTAGAADTQVRTVQGIAGATPVIVGDGSGALNVIVDSAPTTTVTATNLDVQIGGSDTVTVTGTIAATESGTWTVQPGNTPNTSPWLTSIHDGTTKATVRDTGTSDSLNVAIVDGSGNQITSFGGGTQYSEDTLHTTGDTLTMAGVVQQSADSALSGDGDRSFLQVDSNGYLKVNIKAGAGSGGTASADNSTFTGGSTNLTPMGAIYDTTPPSVTDGSVGAPRMNSSRDLRVQAVDGAGDSATDDTNNAIRVNVVAGGAGDGKILDGTASGQADVFDYTNSRPLAVRLTDTNGDYAAAGGGTQYADGAAQATPTGTVALGHDGSNVRAITTDAAGDLQVDVVTMPTTTVTATNLDVQIGGSDTVTVQATNLDVQIGGSDSLTIGTFPDNEPFNLAQVAGSATATGNGTAAGSIRVSVASDSTGQITANAGTNLNTSALLTTTAHDAAFGTAGSADTQVRTIQGIASGTPVQIAGTDGSSASVPYIDPCAREARTQYRVDIVTATTTEIAAATSSEYYWICSINLISAGANNVIIVEDDTATNCPSPTAGVSSGGTTAAEGWNFAANGGIVAGTGANWIMKTTTANRSFCIITSAAVQLSGTITYVSAP